MVKLDWIILQEGKHHLQRVGIIRERYVHAKCCNLYLLD